MRTRSPLTLTALAFVGAALAATAAGCPSYSSYVKSDTALGRVVVYRNGIAYYERKAHVSGHEITLAVPNDKVDDFLKSLTVTDAATGKTLPVSFPTRGASKGRNVDMTIQLPGAGVHDVVLTYITDAPAWKPSYRVMVGDKDDASKVRVQGWAIVDNTSGEDWNQVRVGVGSSSALSFRYDLRSVRTVQRQLLGGEEHFAKAPPTGGSVYGGGGGTGRGKAGKKKAGRAVAVTLSDGEIPRNIGHPQNLPASSTGSGSTPLDVLGGKLGDQGGATLATRTNKRAEQRVAQLAKQLRRSQGNIRIDGYAGAAERNGKDLAEDRANLLRNRLVELGVAPARIRVVAHGPEAGRAAGVKVVEEAAAGAGGEGGGSQPVGESHFESKIPLTVAKGTSAMVSILRADTRGDIVYLYAADGERGNDRYAFKAVRFVNPTASTLETGPVTFYGDGRFIGEGLSDPIPPKATALIPFALDRQVVVEREGATDDRVARVIKLVRGVLTAEVQHTRRTTVKVTNRLAAPTKLYVRHTVQKGWNLVHNPKVYERLDTSYVFEVDLPAGAQKTLTIEESTPLRRTVDLRAPVAVDMVRLYVQLHPEDKRFVAPLKKILALYRELSDHATAIDSLRQRMGEFRARSDELHTQIVSLKSVKAGAKLLRDLEKKMAEISSRTQKATIAVVDHQEKLMMARIRFQDAIAELNLKAPKATTPKPKAPSSDKTSKAPARSASKASS